MPFTHQHIALGPDRSLHAASAGPASPAGEILFFPGNGCSSTDIGPMGDALAERYRVALLDPPGREPSVWPDGPFHFLNDLLPAVDAATQKLALGPHVVIGHSMGGMLALQYANRHREAVRGLVLIEGFVSLAVHQSVVSHEGFRAVRMSNAVRSEWELSIAQNKKWAAAHPKFSETFWPSQYEHDARGFVAALGVPILVVVGDLGQPMPARNDMQAWRRHVGMDDVRDFELLLVPNAGHWAMLDDPPLVTETVTRFLRHALNRG